MRGPALAILWLVAAGGWAGAQSEADFPPPTEPVRVVATRTTDRLKVDGRLDEAAWASATPYGDFFRMEPRQGGELRNATTVRVLYDDEYLYVGAFCADSLGRGGLRVQDLRRDFVYSENDVFYVQLDPQQTRQYCLSFQATPYGNQRDLQVFNDEFLDNDWDALWRVRTQRLDSGYVVEMAIPFKTLRYDPVAPGDRARWGFTAARLARRDYEQSVLPAVPQAYSPYRMTYAAELELEVPDPTVNLRVTPYALAEVAESPNADGAVLESSVEVRAGGEAKWAIDPRSVIDLTVNTDFAQADVDRAVNNLTRFNLLFPERRQFFLENRGLFAGADDVIRPYFSRAIGLSNTQFNAAPVPIDVGARYTYRDDERAVAALYTHQREVSAQPGADFGVLRYLHNYGAENNVGVMGTYRRDASLDEAGFGASHNATLTLDGFNRPTDRLTVSYLASASRDDGGEPGATPATGLAGKAFAGYQAPDFYAGWLTNAVSADYRPDMGFAFGQDVIWHNPGGYYIYRPRDGWLKRHVRRFDPGAFVNVYQSASTLDVQEVSVYLFPIYVITSGNGLIEVATTPTWQRFDFGFDILGREVTPGTYRYARHQLRFTSDQSRKVAYGLSHTFGGYYRGRLATSSAELRVAPVPHATLALSYERNAFTEFGAEREDFTAELATATLRLAVDPRLQAQAFYQYNTLTGEGRINLRGSWEFRPLSFVYLVFDEGAALPEVGRPSALIAKVNYTHQF